MAQARLERMNLFTRLPGFRRSPPGLEWWLLKRLPGVLVAGTVMPIVAAWGVYALTGESADVRFATALHIAVLGLLSLHWTVVLTAAIACVIVVVAKGPAYVADAYPLPDDGRDEPSA
jgi:hypothetical protein